MSQMSEKAKMCIIMAGGVLSLDIKSKKRRRSRIKGWLENRKKYTHMNLLFHLRENEPTDFKNFLRMDEKTFQKLLSLVTPHITKQNT